MTRKKASTAKKGSSTAKRSSPKKATRAADQVPQASDEEQAAASRRFAKSVEANDQAVPSGAPLRRGATHEIIDHEADGTPILKRRRFSIS